LNISGDWACDGTSEPTKSKVQKDTIAIYRGRDKDANTINDYEYPCTTKLYTSRKKKKKEKIGAGKTPNLAYRFIKLNKTQTTSLSFSIRIPKEAY